MKTGELGRRVGVVLGHLQLAVRVLQVVVRPLGITRQKIGDLTENGGNVGLGLGIGLLSLLLRIDVVVLVGAGQEVHAGADESDDRQQAHHRDRGPLLALAPDDHGSDAAARHLALRHPVEDAVDPASQPAVGCDLGVAGRHLDRGHAATDNIDQRDRRALDRARK